MFVTMLSLFAVPALAVPGSGNNWSGGSGPWGDIYIRLNGVEWDDAKVITNAGSVSYSHTMGVFMGSRHINTGFMVYADITAHYSDGDRLAETFIAPGQPAAFGGWWGIV